jgi:hypothetical protein
MERESGGERVADQLQGLVVQDQTVQPGAAADGLTHSSTADCDSKNEKVVIHLGTELVKGYLESHTWTTIEDLLRQAPAGLPTTLRVRRVGSDHFEEIHTQNAKAVFYVNSFEGDVWHKDLKFSTRAPIVHGIWVRLEFLDGELLEGIVYNTIHFLVNPGFFLYPTDPESNNRLVYVFKNQLKDFRILGLRKLQD